MTTDAQTLVGVIEKQERKDSPAGAEREWTMYRFQIEAMDPPGPKRWYGTFDKGWPTNLRTGTQYRFTYEVKQSGEYTNYNLMSAQAVTNGADVGEFQEPYEPPTDEAKAAIAPIVVEAGSKPEFKSPSRSYDQNRDIERRSIERQVALKAAVDMLKDYGVSTENVDLMPEAVMACANAFFAWLREHPPGRATQPSEPVSERYDTSTPGSASYEARSGEEQPAESDGGPALFPPESHDSHDSDESRESRGPHQFPNVGAFRKALKDELGLATTAEVNEALEAAGLNPLATVGNFTEAFATLKYHAEQAEPVENTEG